MEFAYKARTHEGEPREGAVEARSLEAAVETLQQQGLIITSVKPAEEAKLLSRRISFFDRVKPRDVVIMSRQLSTLFQAKLPVVQALKTLLEEAENRTLRNALAGVLDDVSGGSSLSQAFSRHPNIFSQFYVNMVRAGEQSGKLEDVFSFLADYLERNYVLASKAKNALIYPAFVSVAFVGVIVVMLVVVIPKLTAIFSQLSQQVPLYTRIVIAVSNFLRQWGIFLAIFLIILGLVAWRFQRTEKGGEFFDRLSLRLPIFGDLFKKIYLARFTDNLSTLIRAGIPIIRALEITSDVVGSRVYQKTILDAVESVKAGNTIAASFERRREVPSLITQMIRIGEETGQLEFILERASAFYQRDVDNLLQNFVSLIEPVLIIFLGLAVGFMVAAVLVPLYNLSSLL